MRKTEPRNRFLSSPAHIRAVEAAKGQRTALCTCHRDSGRDVLADRRDEEADGEEEEEEEDSSGSRSGSPPDLWQPPQKQPYDRHNRHHDHGLAGLWTPASPHDGPWELWRVMKMWVKARDHLAPLAGADHLLLYTSLTASVTDKLPAARRAWFAWLAGQAAPHVYFSDLVFYGNGYMAASAAPSCAAKAARGGGDGDNRGGLPGGKTDLGVEILMRI